MLYKLASGKAGSTKINGSADALADSANRVLPTTAA